MKSSFQDKGLLEQMSFTLITNQLNNEAVYLNDSFSLVIIDNTRFHFVIAVF